MRVLITGDEGFIGKYLSNYYISRNAEVYGWDIKGVHSGNSIYQPADMMKQEDAEKVLSEIQPDYIYHCAGIADVRRSVETPLLDLESNYITTHNLLFAMKKLRMKSCRFLLFSSAAVYGSPMSLPISEESAVHPLSPYALHKLAAEEVCRFVYANDELDTKIIRIFSAYGPGLKKQIFWDMYNKIMQTGKLELWGSGSESRDYIYIDDLIQAVTLIAHQSPKDTLVYNVANGVETTIRQAAESFADHFGVGRSIIRFNGIVREGDPVNWKADISKLMNLGYSRNVSFDEGIRKYVEWVKEMNTNG